MGENWPRVPEVKRRSLAGRMRSRRGASDGVAAGGEVLVVAGEELEAEKLVVAGDQALDFVEDGVGVEGREARLEVVGGEPDGVTVSLAGLSAAGLAHVSKLTSCPCALAEGHEIAHVRAHLVGNADDHLEVGADAGAVLRPF